MNKPDKKFYNYPMGRTGIFSLSLGLIVIAGWYLKNPLLVRLNNSFVAMQYNTALGFVLIGICLICQVLEKNKIKHISSIILAFLGGLSLMQYMFYMDLHIDEMFMKHFITDKTSHPGRMSPHSAVCFLLSSLLFLPNFKRKFSDQYYRIISAILTGLSLIAFLGYVFSFETAFAWQKFTRMAIHTSFGFLAVGMTCSYTHLRTRIKKGKSWLPFPVFILCLSVFVLIGQGIKQKSNDTKFNSIDDQAKILSDSISDSFNGALQAFARLADRIIYLKGSNSDIWKIDAQSYINDFTFYKTFEFSNENHITRWVYPAAKNKSFVNFEQNFGKQRYKVLEGAKHLKSTTVTRLLNTAKVKNTTLFISPVSQGQKYLGSLTGVVATNKLFSKLMNNYGHNLFLLKVWDKDELIYSSSESRKDTNSKKYNIKLAKFGINWKLEVIPTKKLESQNNSYMGEIVIFFGVLISLLFSFLVFQYLSREELYQKLEAERVKLMQSSKMASLGLLSAGVAHEVNNPLAIIKGNATMIVRCRDNPEKLKKAIVNIENNVDRISKIIGGLKKYSRKSEKLEVSHQSIKKIITESMSIVESKCQRNQVDLLFDKLIDVDIELDEVQLVQVLTNLLTNAVDAATSDENGWVKISTLDSLSEYKIYIQDSGKGIKPKELDRIFEPFYTTKTVGKGTGLGLSISAGIVESHHGSLEYELKDGHTTFVLTLSKKVVHSAA